MSVSVCVCVFLGLVRIDMLIMLMRAVLCASKRRRGKKTIQEHILPREKFCLFIFCRTYAASCRWEGPLSVGSLFAALDSPCGFAPEKSPPDSEDEDIFDNYHVALKGFNPKNR